MDLPVSPRFLDTCARPADHGLPLQGATVVPRDHRRADLVTLSENRPTAARRGNSPEQ